MLWSSLNSKINHFLKLILSYLAVEVKTEQFVSLFMSVTLFVVTLVTLAIYL